MAIQGDLLGRSVRLIGIDQRGARAAGRFRG
jgi:hypothetical protein